VGTTDFTLSNKVYFGAYRYRYCSLYAVWCDSARACRTKCSRKLPWVTTPDTTGAHKLVRSEVFHAGENAYCGLLGSGAARSRRRYQRFGGTYHLHSLGSHTFLQNVGTLVAKYLRASLTVTNTQDGSQPAVVRGGRGSDSAQGVLLPPYPYHLPFPTYCDVAHARRYFACIITTHNTKLHQSREDHNQNLHRRENFTPRSPFVTCTCGWRHTARKHFAHTQLRPVGSVNCSVQFILRRADTYTSYTGLQACCWLPFSLCTVP
jgi:hypothetical protein